MREKDFLDSIRGKEINFLIGSGASVGAVPTLWMNSLGCSYEELLTSTEFDEEEINILYYIWFQLWISKTQILTENVEYQHIHDQYKEFVSNVVRILNEEGFDKPKRANIFTTNYDTFFELAFDEVAKQNRGTYFNDGSSGFIKKYVSSENYYKSASFSGINNNFDRNIPTINLIKLHGSITWKKEESNDSIEVNLNNEIFDNIKKQANKINDKIASDDYGLGDKIINKFLDSKLEKFILEDLASVEELKELFEEFDAEFISDIKEFNESFHALPVVNPTERKFSETVFEQHYYQMLRMLSFELERKDSVLIVFGFSFADRHIMEIVRRSMNNPFLQSYIISYSDKSKNKTKNLLGSELRVNYLPKDFKNKDGNYINGNFIYLNYLLKGAK